MNVYVPNLDISFLLLFFFFPKHVLIQKIEAIKTRNIDLIETYEIRTITKKGKMLGLSGRKDLKSTKKK